MAAPEIERREIELTEFELVATIPAQCVLGEGPVWDHRTGSLSFTDIQSEYRMQNGDSGRVTAYNSDRRRYAQIQLPVSQVTCVAFGGDKLDRLFVTSAREGLSPEQLLVEPHAGMSSSTGRALPVCRRRFFAAELERMRSMRNFVLALMLTILALPGVAVAQSLEFGPMLSDGAVLQRGQPVTVSGTAAPLAQIAVRLGGNLQIATAGANGEWRVTFPALTATTGIALSATTGNQRVEVRNVSAGDVFLCSGQSNMQFSMAETAINPVERKVSVDRTISLMSVPIATARAEQTGFAGPVQWINAHDGSADFSAVCLLAGRDIARSQKVPIGLIDASMGGTPIESWMPYDGLKLAGGMEEGLAILDAFRADPVKAEAELGARLDAIWKMPPPPGQDPDRPRMGYANLFNAMVAPLSQTRLAGVIWYQGENNTRRPHPRAAYRRQLQALLASWRSRFGEDLPFVIVQLAPFGRLSGEPEESNWSEVREAQRLVAAEDPLVEMVTTVDVGERLDIHPPLKKPVGQRAAAALAYLVYNGPAEVLGPRPLSAAHAGSTVQIAIAGSDAGLMAASWGRPGPFILCAEKPERDCQFADARLVAGGIAVSVPTGFTPAIVRYCWGSAPVCNVFDRAQRPLPAFELPVTEGS